MKDKIIALYAINKSMKKTSMKLGVSNITVKKTLFDAGLLSSPRSEKIRELYESGITVKGIAEKLLISESCVNSYLPYVRGSYLNETKTKNAIYISNWRTKKQK